jgi:hypothetical protein
MRKLSVPTVNFDQSFDECISGIGSAATRQRYEDNLAIRTPIEQNYSGLATAGNLFSLPRYPSGPGLNPEIHGVLTSSELKKLYNQYLVPKEKPGRSVYEKLKVTANGKCPFCGDIGHVATLDHFLPKANFPLYSILPGNLVPCCRDCNSEKLNSYASTKGEQVLHPYFDGNHFFDTRWVAAEVIEGDLPVVQFYVAPPAGWSSIDTQRIAAHFIEYDLAKKFGREAAADIPETVHMRRTALRELSPADFSSYLLERSVNLHSPVNNWRRVMFEALAQSNWFCNQAFV